MGVYDEYGSVQLKIGDVALRQFEIGDDVPICDGVYVGYDAVIVIVSGVFVAEFPHVTTKWGDIRSPLSILERHDYVKAALRSMEGGERPQ